MRVESDLPEEQLLRPGEKIDDLQRSGLRIIQDPARFCFGMDAVLLTGFIQEGIGGRSMAREELLDLGTGTGIIPLLMSAKSDCSFLTGLEIPAGQRGNGIEKRKAQRARGPGPNPAG